MRIIQKTTCRIKTRNKKFSVTNYLHLRFAKNHFGFLTVVYCAIATLIYLKYGVKYVNDSDRYLAYAKGLTNSFYIEDHNFWYIGYAYFIAFISFISKELWVLIFAQYILGYLAVIAIYHTALKLFSDFNSALLSSLLMVLFIEIPTWNSYVLAESFYISCVCFTLLLLADFNQKRRLSTLPLVVLFVIFTFFIKPTGISLLTACVAVFIVVCSKRFSNQWIKLGIVVLAGFCVMLLGNGMLKTFHVIENYQLGEVIYAVSTLPPSPKYEMLVVERPVELFVPDKDQPQIIRILAFIAHHPVYWFTLAFRKLFFFVVHVRPYWSIGHNIFSIIFLLPTYIFCVRGMFKKSVNFPVRIFAITYLTMHLVIIGLTSEDWDGRFLMPLLPVIFLFASFGITSEFRNRSFGLPIIRRRYN